MEQSIDNPIASRTRSHTHTENADSNEIDLEQQGDNIEQLTTTIDSLSVTSTPDKEHQQLHDVEKKYLTNSPIHETTDNVNDDDKPSYSNIILQQLRDTFVAELAQTQKTSNVRRFDSLDPRLNTAEIFSADTDSDRTDLSILCLNRDVNLSRSVCTRKDFVCL